MNGSSPIPSAICRSGTAGWSTQRRRLGTARSQRQRHVPQPGQRTGRPAARRQKLRNGDRIKFGLYELEVIIDEDEEGAAPDRGGSLSSHRRGDVAMRDPPPSRSDHRPYDDAGTMPGCPSSAFGAGRRPIRRSCRPDFDPLAPNQEPFAGPTQPDHAAGARKRLPPAPAGGRSFPTTGTSTPPAALAASNGAPPAAATAAKTGPAPQDSSIRRHRARARAAAGRGARRRPGGGLPARRRAAARQRCRIRRRRWSDIGSPPCGRPSAVFGRP